MYLASERGQTVGTIENYERTARMFLEDRVARVGGLELERLSAADVTGFLARGCPRRSVSGARDLAARLRQVLRYLHVAGLIEVPLVWAVPPVADLRGRSLPKAVAPEVITALLSSCDLESVIGRRDFAVLLLLSRLGMRAGEVAAIVEMRMEPQNGGTKVVMREDPGDMLTAFVFQPITHLLVRGHNVE